MDHGRQDMMPTTPKYVYIRTFGCQMNEHDSENIKMMLANLGYLDTDTPDKADIILYNTCTIREKAHQKAMSEIGRSKTYKRCRPAVLIGVCGCVAQEEKTALFERYPHIDLIFGPDQIWRLPELIGEARTSGRATALDLVDDPSEYQFLETRDPGSETRKKPMAFVSIMKGCNCACSYCIVPSVRGREVCRDPDEIIGEINSLVTAGTKEVTLLGQNVNAYRFPGLGFRVSGFGNHQVITFATLLQRISQETEVLRIRFTSPHPRDVSGDLIQQYAENERLMPHIHLPVQAGSNKVLRLMRRGYMREHYIEICDALRRARPGMSITTDIIAGFPGEGESDFGETIDLMHQVEFDSCFAFKYSPRPGTEAAEKFEDDVAMAEKEERLDRVLALQRKTSLKKNKDLTNTVSLALVTGLDKMKRGLITGRLPDNRIVNFAGHLSLIGNIVPVRITEAHPNSLAGEMVANS